VSIASNTLAPAFTAPVENPPAPQNKSTRYNTITCIKKKICVGRTPGEATFRHFI
jgi:hypothetical protein